MEDLENKIKMIQKWIELHDEYHKEMDKNLTREIDKQTRIINKIVDNFKVSE